MNIRCIYIYAIARPTVVFGINSTSGTGNYCKADWNSPYPSAINTECKLAVLLYVNTTAKFQSECY